MKRKFIVLSLLSVLVIALGIAVPAYMNREQPTSIGGPFHTPRPTSTSFSEPLTDIVEVVEVDEPQPETSDEGTNCTYPLYYWSDYPDSWPSQIIIAGKIYTREDISEIFQTGDPDTATLLIRELYTAFLNILGGASHTRIDPVIVDANNWLETNPPGTVISELNQQMGMNLAAGLEDYNNGLNGPPPCQDVPPTPTPSATATAAIASTETNTPAPTRRAFTPSVGQPPSNNQSAPPGSPSQPTATPASPTATAALMTSVAPLPTFSLVPPTAAPTLTPWFTVPTATNTPLPLAPTATNPPPPTSTNTARPTSTYSPLPPPSTNTPLPPPSTNTPLPPPSTNTPIPPTSTYTPAPPTSTYTPVPPTNTPTPEPIPTRNPHYVSPTPTPEPTNGDEPPEEAVISSWLLEAAALILGGE